MLSFAEVHKNREQKKKSKEVQSLSLQASLAFSDLLPVFSIIAGRRGLLCSLLSFFLPGET